jgi:pimeloyl-ACP methyl ester carboxylesterase
MTAVEAKMHAQCPVRYKTVRVNNQDKFRLVAPDDPGYGQRSMPDGGPISYRVALKHPEVVQAPIMENGNAHEEGLLEFRDWQRSR